MLNACSHWLVETNLNLLTAHTSCVEVPVQCVCVCKGLSGNLFIGPYVIFDADLHIGLKDGFALNKLLCPKKKCIGIISICLPNKIFLI